MVCQWFGFKTTEMISLGLASKLVADFLVEHQNQGRQFVSGLASKLLGQFSLGLVSKPVVSFLVEPQN
jgi:uncharacterized membrane protein YhhN